MADVAYVVALVAFFVVAALYVRACDWLGRGDGDESR